MDDISGIKLNSLTFFWDGIYLWLDEDREDFWVYLGKDAGWGRFTNWDRRHRIQCALGRPPFPFELVEIRPANELSPHPQFSPWRRNRPSSKSGEIFPEGWLVPAE